MQPQAKTLQEEPVWTSLTKVADWAELHAVPTIWSCLAAHAFVLHFDGIPRCRLPEKMSGIFECALPPDRNRLTQGLPSTWFSPHSRYHGLPEDQLVAAGYQILSWSNEAGADIVLKSGAVPTLLFQGHPEYAGDTLLREYMRDIRRYRDGEHREYPIAPRSYFDRETAIALDLFRRIALERHQAPALSEISSLVDSAAYPCQWRLPAARLIENWLALVVESGAPFRRFPGRSTGTPAAFSDARSGLVP
jgi:homoserine O-succinyltransferase